MSISADMAQAVVNLINDPPDETFAAGTTVTAKRVYLPAHTIEELANLSVGVWAVGGSQELIARDDTNRTVTLTIGIQKKLTSETAEEIDPLCELCEAIGSLLVGHEFESPNATCDRVDHSLANMILHMEQYRVFTWVIEAEFTIY